MPGVTKRKDGTKGRQKKERRKDMARIKRRCICPVCDTERPATIDKDGRLTIDSHRPSFKKSEEVWPINSRGECRGSGIDVAEGELGSLFYAIIHEIFGKIYTKHFHP